MNSMANMYDYLTWRGDLQFDRDPVHDPDMLIFAALSYTDLPELESNAMTIHEIHRRYVEEKIQQSQLIFDPAKLLQLCAESHRYRNVVVEHCRSTLDHDQVMQFCAMSFRYDNHKVVIAYRGTDTTLTGWQEDLYFAAIDETSAQSEAIKFMNDFYTGTQDEILVTGHSKGGNLAQYASIKANDDIRERIKGIWSMDGPGFKEHLIQSNAFQQMKDKMHRVVPEQSFVGMLMDNPVQPIICKSDAFFMGQHMPDTWQILGPGFERASQLSNFSQFVWQTVDKWLENMTDEEKLHFTDNVFALLSSGGAQTLDDMVDNPFKNSKSIISMFVHSDKQTQQRLGEVIGKLLNASGDTLKGSVFKDRKNIEDR